MTLFESLRSISSFSNEKNQKLNSKTNISSTTFSINSFENNNICFNGGVCPR
ncbi:hypothetical protein DDB_G0276231 [Dictyostelium discoideum AX4]|uniref:Uncharacterized protein DDB_G0276231 n=1 Tax=Dictyostelium discoideum TaxID=44689 RepID=Y7757_DICDI|nr:hypothetical protein DDB_G0276231 [Dictyostelium discoideum AX4]Q75JF4.1 RecName: Full=Uncharacterized protein DDB_G0276231 [Dictyostelium discoideum]EAL69415.1 hypothetical protein DDB_G0276231 [Dictyostelium discoideum AX4]|eukprot:XP_643244.1 hypothetical protein DDB_G0276231 [Dictyostelium discoideum AX4]